MWICSRCQSANKDGYTQCVQCSAPRNARRFGAGTPVGSPSVQGASDGSQAMGRRSAYQAYQQQNQQTGYEQQGGDYPGGYAGQSPDDLGAQVGYADAAQHAQAGQAGYAGQVLPHQGEGGLDAGGAQATRQGQTNSRPGQAAGRQGQATGRQAMPGADRKTMQGGNRQVMSSPPVRSTGRLVRTVGRLLAILLPLLVLTLSVVQVEAIKPVVLSTLGITAEVPSVPAQPDEASSALLADDAATANPGVQQGDTALSPQDAAALAAATDNLDTNNNSLLPWLIYGAMVFLALLLALAPGLALWALGHLARGVRGR